MKSKKKRSPLGVRLDVDEKEIERLLPESWDKLPITKNAKEELAFAKKAAANYLRKDTKINIRLSHCDVEGLRRLAVREGLPYQTLIASILHKYVSHHIS